MATKAELEAELSALKEELRKSQSAAKEAEEQKHEATEPPARENLTEGLDLELPDGFAKDLINELEGFAKEKPLVTIVAAFVLGYALGRGR